MDCGTAPYPLSLAINVGGCCCIGALPENTIPEVCGRIPAAVIHAPVSAPLTSEEMGITCPLAFIFSMNYRSEVSNNLVEDEIVHVFGGHFNGIPTPNQFEVSDWCWKPFTEVERDVDERPEVYSVWFRKIRYEFWKNVVGSLKQSLV